MAYWITQAIECRISLTVAASPTSTKEREATTVQNLLDMISGIEWTQPLVDEVPTSMIEMRRSPDWLKFVLGGPMSRAPSQTFNYSDGNEQLLSTIITKITGRRPWTMQKPSFLILWE